MDHVDQVELGGEFFSKADEGLLYAVSYAAGVRDLQNDWISQGELQKAAHAFQMNRGRIFIEHRQPVSEDQVSVVESYVTPQNVQINGHEVKRGSWVIVLKVHDSDLWADIRAGKYRGLSIAGSAKRNENSELRDLSLQEVSLVKNPASGIRFLALKSADAWTPEFHAHVMRAIEVIDAKIEEARQEFLATKRGLRQSLASPELREELLKTEMSDAELTQRLADFCEKFERIMRQEFQNSRAPVQHADRGADDIDQSGLGTELRHATDANYEECRRDNEALYRRHLKNRTRPE